MTRRWLGSPWSRTIALALAVLGAVALVFNLLGDAQALARLGAELGRRDAALSAPLVRATGGVLEHLAFRAGVHAFATVVLLTLVVVLVARPRSVRGRTSPA